jgi:hypothetical protein
LSELTGKDVLKSALGSLNTALRQFGEYNYYDKGASEVMDLGPIGQQLIELGPVDAAWVVDKILRDRHGDPLASSLIVCMQDWGTGNQESSDPNFDVFYEHLSQEAKDLY